MGLRGPGAARLKRAREQAENRPKRKPAWQKKGLSRADRVIKFLESLPITKGPLAGKRMKLLPGQRHFVERIYGDLKPNGRRRVRIGVKSEPKGNGKTGLTAGLCLCHLLGPESEPRGEVYSAAVDREQSGKMYAEMEAIIAQEPDFACRVNAQRFLKKLEVLDGPGKGSIYEAMSADARKGHAISPSLWVYDELAQVHDRELLDNLLNGMGKRSEALGLVISTQARDDDHPLSQLIDDGLSGADPSIYVDLRFAAEDEDIYNKAVWFKVNEALGKFLSVDEFAEKAALARRNPAFEASFRNLRLNQRVDAGSEKRLCTATVWKMGAVPVDAKALAGRPCFGGLDLSGKHDLTSFTLVFPDDEQDPGYDVLQWFWTPRGAMDRRKTSEQERFRLWIERGFITPIDGPVIRFSQVARDVAAICTEYDVQSIGYDRWRIEDFKLELSDIGAELPFEPFGQGFRDMSPAVERFAELALTARIRHGGNPVLTACVANAIVVADGADNLKIDKGMSNARATTRIDGAVTLVMALGMAHRAPPERPPITGSDVLMLV